MRRRRRRRRRRARERDARRTSAQKVPHTRSSSRRAVRARAERTTTRARVGTRPRLIFGSTVKMGSIFGRAREKPSHSRWVRAGGENARGRGGTSECVRLSVTIARDEDAGCAGGWTRRALTRERRRTTRKSGQIFWRRRRRTSRRIWPMSWSESSDRRSG